MPPAPPTPLQGHSHYVTSVAWSPDGKQLASGSWDKSLHLWDAVSGACAGTLKVSGGRGCRWAGCGAGERRRPCRAARCCVRRVCRAVRVIHTERAAGRVGAVLHSTPSFWFLPQLWLQPASRLADRWVLDFVWCIRIWLKNDIPCSSFQLWAGGSECNASNVFPVCVRLLVAGTAGPKARVCVCCAARPSHTAAGALELCHVSRL